MRTLHRRLAVHEKRVYGVINGEIPAYPEMRDDTVVMTKMIFAAPCMFWMTLWSIKFSLLFLYRRLLTGISSMYTKIWWAIVGFCIVVRNLPQFLTHMSRGLLRQAQVGNYVLYFRSCGTIPGFWNDGCSGSSAVHSQLVSLYYSFAADTSTNFMSMYPFKPMPLDSVTSTDLLSYGASYTPHVEPPDATK